MGKSDRKDLLFSEKSARHDFEIHRRPYFPSCPAVLYPALWAPSAATPPRPAQLSPQPTAGNPPQNFEAQLRHAEVGSGWPLSTQVAEPKLAKPAMAGSTAAPATIPVESVLEALRALRTLLLSSEEECSALRLRLAAAEAETTSATAEERARPRAIDARLGGKHGGAGGVADQAAGDEARRPPFPPSPHPLTSSPPLSPHLHPPPFRW